MRVEIGDAFHALHLNQRLRQLEGYGHIAPAISDSNAPAKTVGTTVQLDSSTEVLVDGTQVATTETEITLTSSDPELPRWDVIYVKPDGTLASIQGQPAELVGSAGRQARSPPMPDIDGLDGTIQSVVYRRPNEVEILDQYVYDIRLTSILVVEELTADTFFGDLDGTWVDLDENLSIGTEFFVRSSSEPSTPSSDNVTLWNSGSEIKAKFSDGSTATIVQK